MVRGLGEERVLLFRDDDLESLALLALRHRVPSWGVALDLACVVARAAPIVTFALSKYSSMHTYLTLFRCPHTLDMRRMCNLLKCR